MRRFCFWLLGNGALQNDIRVDVVDQVRVPIEDSGTWISAVKTARSAEKPSVALRAARPPRAKAGHVGSSDKLNGRGQRMSVYGVPGTCTVPVLVLLLVQIRVLVLVRVRVRLLVLVLALALVVPVPVPVPVLVLVLVLVMLLIAFPLPPVLRGTCWARV